MSKRCQGTQQAWARKMETRLGCNGWHAGAIQRSVNPQTRINHVAAYERDPGFSHLLVNGNSDSVGGGKNGGRGGGGSCIPLQNRTAAKSTDPCCANATERGIHVPRSPNAPLISSSVRFSRISLAHPGLSTCNDAIVCGLSRNGRCEALARLSQQSTGLHNATWLTPQPP